MTAKPTILSNLQLRHIIGIIIILILFCWKKRDDIMINYLSGLKIEIFHQTTKYYNAKRISAKEINQNSSAASNLKRKDWHNYTQIKYEKQRVGLGEQGHAGSLQDASQEINSYSLTGYNAALSDKIPLNRSLPDIRHPACKNKLYLESLPTVSIIVPFYNEHWSVLLRTVYSAQYRAPEHLIKEIFIIDDASTKESLKEKLEIYVAKHLPKVKVLRLPVRSGLITARLVGAKEATGDVLVFLDAHVEANVNWLPPLLEPIALDYRVVVCAYVDQIMHDTFKYIETDDGRRGGFDWEMWYRRMPLFPKDRENLPEPFESPVMMGGLFAISRAFFWELGGYDTGLDIWGAEQFELSFKIWQCGGRILDAPCSRFGHILHKFVYRNASNHDNYFEKNNIRVIEVWMDEYAEYVYMKNPVLRTIDPGDLTEQKKLRQKLKCKSFRWFMTEIAYDIPEYFPCIDPKPFAEGRIRPLDNKELCIDGLRSDQGEAVVLRNCTGEVEQDFSFTYFKDVMVAEKNLCWDVPSFGGRGPVLLYDCHHSRGHQEFRYREAEKRIYHVAASTCLDHNPKTLEIFLDTCKKNSTTQLWDIDVVCRESMARWDDISLDICKGSF